MDSHSNQGKPSAVADILKQAFLFEYEITQNTLPTHSTVGRYAHKSLCKPQILTREIALRLSEHFGTSTRFWLEQKSLTDVWNAIRNKKNEALESIQSIEVDVA